MRHGSLFSGIGGFDIAAEWMGWENIFHCEINPFGQKVLKYYWPKSIQYHDITKTNFTIHRGTIHIITGGFPCQPYSLAGKRKGKEDERHLWPEMLRVIREVAPTYIVGENVYGLVNWNGGLVFHEVQADLEAEGYEVQPVILPACSVNAPHKRERIWFVAYSASNRLHPGDTDNNRPGKNGKTNGFGDVYSKEDATDPKCERFQKSEQSEQFEQLFDVERNDSQYDASDTFDTGLQRNQRTGTHGERNGKEAFRPTTQPIEIRAWDNWPTQPPVRG